MCVFLTMGFLDSKRLSQLYLELVHAYRKKIMPYSGQVAALKSSSV